MKHYKLNHTGEPVLADNLMESFDMVTEKLRVVAQTEVNGMKVSTVFLHINHNRRSPGVVGDHDLRSQGIRFK